MSFRRQADNFMKWREGGVVPVDAFFTVSGRALNARQNRLARRRPGQYYCFDREQAYSEPPKPGYSEEWHNAFREKERKKRQRDERARQRVALNNEEQAPKWTYFWRPAAEPYSLGPFKIKNEDDKRWLTLTLVEEEILTDGAISHLMDYENRDEPKVVNAAMRSIWGSGSPLDYCISCSRKWKITHSPRG